MTNLYERAIACKHWRWMPGMRMLHPRMGPARVLRDTQQGVWVAKEESLASGFRVDEDGCLTDLSDPATLGCLLALVREAGFIIHKLAILPLGTQLVIEWPDGRLVGYEGKTEAAALVAALEAAEGREVTP